MIAYLLERARPGIFLPAAVLIAIGGQVGEPFDPGRSVMAIALTLSLIAQFRLWDDLVDIDRDRLRHPQRVLSRSAHLDRFVLGCLFLALSNMWLAAWIGGVDGVVILILLDASMATWYALRPRHRTAAGDLIVLAKYPAFLFVIAGPAALSAVHLVIAGAIYIAACSVEIWHDASSPLRPGVNA